MILEPVLHNVHGVRRGLALAGVLLLIGLPARGADPRTSRDLLATCQASQDDASFCESWLREEVLARACTYVSQAAVPSLSAGYALGAFAEGQALGYPCSLLAGPVAPTDSFQQAQAKEARQKLARLAKTGEQRDLAGLYSVLIDARPEASCSPWEDARNLLQTIGLSSPPRDPFRPVAPAVLLLRAQALLRSGLHAEAARVALDLIDFFPLDRRTLAAHIIIARQLGMSGSFEDALQECREVERAGLEPEAGEARRLASLLWVHWRIGVGRKADREPEEYVQDPSGHLKEMDRGDVVDLAVSENGLVALASEKGLTVSAPAPKRDSRLLSIDECTGVSFDTDGILTAQFAGRGLQRYRSVGLGKPLEFLEESWPAWPATGDDKIQERTIKTLEACRFPRVDEEGGTWLVCGDRVASLRPCFGFVTDFEVSLRSPTAGGNLSGLHLSPTHDVIGVMEKPRKSEYQVAVRAGAPGDKAKLPVGLRIRSIKAAAQDALGWQYLLVRDRPGDRVLIVDPQVGGVVAWTKAEEDVAYSGIAVDGSGNVYVAWAPSRVYRFRWRFMP